LWYSHRSIGILSAEIVAIESDLSNGASYRGTAVPAVITGGTPVPRFMSLCIGHPNMRIDRTSSRLPADFARELAGPLGAEVN